MEDKCRRDLEEKYKKMTEKENKPGITTIVSADCKESVRIENKGKMVKQNSLRGKAERSKATQFKKGYTPWNFKGGIRLKRKYRVFKGKFMLNSHAVWLEHNNLDKIPKGYVIHHKDGDSLNDRIENLILMTDKAHKQLQKKAGEDLI